MRRVFLLVLVLLLGSGCLGTKAEAPAAVWHEVEGFDDAYAAWTSSRAAEEWDVTMVFPSLSEATFAMAFVDLGSMEIECRYLDTETGRLFRDALEKQEWARTYDMQGFMQEVGGLMERCDASTIEVYRRLVTEGSPARNSTFGLYSKHPELVEFYVVHAAGMDFWTYGATGVVDARTGEVYL